MRTRAFAQNEMESVNFFERRRRARPQSADQSVQLQPGEQQGEQSAEEGPSQSLERSAESPAKQEVPARAAPTVPAAGGASGAPRALSALERLKSLAASAPPIDGLDPSMMGGDDRDDDRDDDSPPEAERTSPDNVREVSGRVLSVRVFNDWAVANMVTSTGDELKITGSLVASVKDGLSYKVVGVEREHPQHGRALELTALEPTLEADESSIARFLSKNVAGVGNSRAYAYIAALKKDAVADMPPDASLADRRERYREVMQRLADVLIHRPWNLDVNAIIDGLPVIEIGQATPSQEDSEGNEAAAASALRVRKEMLAEVLKRSFMLSFGALKNFKEPAARGLAAFYAGKVVSEAEPVARALAMLSQDPYEPVGEAPGYGFATADLLGRHLGLPEDAPARLRVLGPWVVSQVCNRKGHTWLKSGQFVAEIRRSFPGLSPQSVITEGIRSERLVVEPEAGRIYTKELHRAESRLASALAVRAMFAKPLIDQPYEQVAEFLRHNAHKINPTFKDSPLDEAQVHAVASILTEPSGVHVLRGGPGTGKTTIVECIVWMLKGRSEFLFAAPTGKAAKVLSKRVKSMGAHASTICSMLRGTDDVGYEVDADDPLTCDVLVTDESTMMGVVTADAVMQALPRGSHIIILGDPGRTVSESRPGRAGQLPSISPGRFMHDLQIMPAVHNVELERVYRNSGGILDVVEQVAAGKLEVKDKDSVSFRGLPDPERANDEVLSRYVQLARQDGLANTALIMPVRAGDVNKPSWSVTWVNAVLREVFNRDGQKMPGTIFRLGDRIIVRNKNLSVEQPGQAIVRAPGPKLDAAHVRKVAGIDEPEASDEGDDSGDKKEERIVNGDTGFIVGWKMDPDNPRLGLPKWIQLQLDDGRLVWLPGEELAVLDHGYALTVHAVQGSEYKHVLCVITDGSPEFMNANMLLTAFSRPKQTLHVWGDPAVLKRVAATPLPERNSALPERFEKISAPLRMVKCQMEEGDRGAEAPRG